MENAASLLTPVVKQACVGDPLKAPLKIKGKGFIVLDFGTDSAVEIMKKYYGGMLRAGATSFWEDFHLDWLEGAGRIDEFVPSSVEDLHGDRGDFCYKGFRHSLCHAWSMGIIAFMKENNL